MKVKKSVLILSLFALASLLAFIFYYKAPPLKKAQEKPKARIAIVLDDWGYNLRCVDLLEQIDAPLTISILPNLKYSTQIAEIANKRGHQVILHLPLEPEKEGRNIGLERNTITADMPEAEILRKVTLALSGVPYVKGVSNHMGSRATKDERIMSVIFTELKKKDLFFLDNLVTNKSICPELAAKLKVKFACRNFFLDNVGNYEYIKKQFEKLSNFALRNKQSIGIGHDRAVTLQVLTDQLSVMRAKGIKFVFLSDLVK